jgi:hypothetical protein
MSKTEKWRDLKLPLTPAVVTSLPFSALVSALLPRAGWRVMFAIGGVGALIAFGTCVKPCRNRPVGWSRSAATKKLRPCCSKSTAGLLCSVTL